MSALEGARSMHCLYTEPAAVSLRDDMLVMTVDYLRATEDIRGYAEVVAVGATWWDHLTTRSQMAWEARIHLSGEPMPTGVTTVCELPIVLEEGLGGLEVALAFTRRW